MSKVYEPPHGKTNKMIFAPSEDSDQPGQSMCAQCVGRDPGFLRTAKTVQTGRIWFCHEAAHISKFFLFLSFFDAMYVCTSLNYVVIKQIHSSKK